MDTEGALLHDPVLSDRHVGVQLPVERLRNVAQALAHRLLVRIGVPVENADLVRAVVRTVSRPDTAVVDLRVDAVGRVIRSEDRTDRLAGGVPAVLTNHR